MQVYHVHYAHAKTSHLQYEVQETDALLQLQVFRAHGTFDLQLHAAAMTFMLVGYPDLLLSISCIVGVLSLDGVLNFHWFSGAY